ADLEGRTLLHRAVIQGAVGLVDVLVARHVEVNAGDQSGTTPLHEAVAGERLDIIARLLEAGADVNLGDGARRTPLFYAVKYGYTDVIEMLLERHADVNARDMTGGTPLHEAVESNQFSALNALLRGRADATIAARDGRTPLELAQHLGRKSMVDVLQRYQAARRHAAPPPAPASAPAPADPSEVERLRAALETARREVDAARARPSSLATPAFAALCDAVPGSVYVLRPDGAFLYVSASALRKLGVAREALLGQRWSAPPFPAQAAELFDHCREAVLASGEPAHGVLHLHAGGVTYSYRYVVAPIREDEAITAVMVVLLDDQGKGELEERLTRAHYALHETEMKLSRERAAREALERAREQRES
ncbi:MAG TPA: ankyrin repeat domain-containing protein, partial [Armatimonadota bacterium]|nr:ankyrin repeat domain-containing protein [Armatimonadota bacterium]